MSKISKKSSEGVTLLIAILVLSIVMAVSFSLSTILLAESRNSGDLTRTEPALYGATSVTEEALYNVKRSTGEEHFSSTVGSTDIDTIATPLNDPVQKIKIPSNATTFSQNNPNVYALYNPDNPYGPSDYGEIKLTFLDTNTPGSKIHIYLCQWDPQNPPQNADGTYKNVCSDPNDISAPNYWAVRDFQISPGQTWDTLSDCGGCMNSSYQQELILYQSNGDRKSVV